MKPSNVVLKTKVKFCKECHTEFLGTARSKYCSDSCREKNRLREYQKKMQTDYPSVVYYRYKMSDRKKHMENDLTVAWIRAKLKDAKCVYCGRTLSLGFDRIDNSIGHTMSNVVVACAKCNKFRGNYLTVVQFKKVIDYIKSFTNW